MGRTTKPGRKTPKRSRPASPRRNGSRKTPAVKNGSVPAVDDSAASLLRPGLPPDAASRLDQITLSPRAAARLRQHFQNPARRKRGTIANVLALHERGMTVTEIAGTLELSPRTVSGHLARARRRGTLTDGQRRDPRDRGLHEPGAGAWEAARTTHRHLVVRLCTVRDADGGAGLPRRDPMRHRSEDSPNREPGWDALPAHTPSPISRLLRRTLGEGAKAEAARHCGGSPGPRRSDGRVIPGRDGPCRR